MKVVSFFAGCGGAITHDYNEVKTFLETLYVSNRLRLPLKESC